jgi:hypothetical protein
MEQVERTDLRAYRDEAGVTNQEIADYNDIAVRWVDKAFSEGLPGRKADVMKNTIDKIKLTKKGNY